MRSHIGTPVFAQGMLLSCFLSIFFVGLESADVSSQCQSVIETDLSQCLAYSMAKTDTPSGSCCCSVLNVRNNRPTCLCYVIQQANSNPEFKKSGLRLDRTLQLPAACNISTQNINLCPTLLNLNSSSPDYNIFNTSVPTYTGPVQTCTSSGVGGHQLRYAAGLLGAVALTVVLLHLF